VRHTLQQLWTRTDGAVAPTVALSLVALIAAGGIAFDYARVASLQTELHNAADQAALAAATQLDGQANATSRAVAAAQSLLTNKSLFGNDTCGTSIDTGVTDSSCSAGGAASRVRITFYSNVADADAGTNGYSADPTKDGIAKAVEVEVAERKAVYALTPIVGAFSSGSIGAEAVAAVGHAICKTPPVMLCNPAEPASNGNVDLDYNPTPGIGLRLVTGDASVPGNFGWLEAAIGNGANALAGELGYNTPLGDCQPITGVTTKTGMSTSVLNAFNTRFDVYANGNTTCPSQYGGDCSPSTNTRKDVVCKPNAAKTGCSNDSWDEAATPYRLPTDTTTTTTTKCTGPPKNPTCVPVTTTTTATSERVLKSGDTYPSIMGYPHDLCHAWPRNAQTCGGNNIAGNGTWDRDAYFKVNYGYADATAWQAATGLPANASRWKVYQWELANRSLTVGGKAVGIDSPQQGASATEYAFSYPATGRAGAAASTSQADRRRMSIAVLNCQALNAHGKTTEVPVPTWLDVFLVEPAVSRDKKSYTDDKDIYVEVIGKTTSDTGVVGQVVRRDVPYLIR
jgi:Flp pilus assembly protein TadG